MGYSQIHHAQFLQRNLQRALFKPAARTYDHLSAALGAGDDGELHVVQARRANN